MFLPISHMPPSGIMRSVARLGCSLARERIVGGFLPTSCRVWEMNGLSACAPAGGVTRRRPVWGCAAGFLPASGLAAFARGAGAAGWLCGVRAVCASCWGFAGLAAVFLRGALGAAERAPVSCPASGALCAAFAGLACVLFGFSILLSLASAAFFTAGRRRAGARFSFLTSLISGVLRFSLSVTMISFL